MVAAGRRKGGWALSLTLDQVLVVHERAVESCRGLGITMTELRVLRFLEGGARPMTAIAEHIDRTTTWVTSVADALEGKGLVQRQWTKEDRRIRALRVTGAGLQVLRKVEAALPG